MILTLKTSGDTAEISILNSDGTIVVADSWESGRKLSSELLEHLQNLLLSARLEWPKLSGLVVFRGPGSFTGLRIGITVANTVSYAQGLSIVGTIGDNWIEAGLKRLEVGQNDIQVLPEYGAPPNITKPSR